MVTLIGTTSPASLVKAVQCYSGLVARAGTKLDVNASCCSNSSEMTVWTLTDFSHLEHIWRNSVRFNPSVIRINPHPNKPMSVSRLWLRLISLFLEQLLTKKRWGADRLSPLPAGRGPNRLFYLKSKHSKWILNIHTGFILSGLNPRPGPFIPYAAGSHFLPISPH